MQAELAGHFTQGQWAQRLFAELQERGLLVEQAAHHPQQGLAAGLQALEQPACLLQVGAHVAGVGLAAAADQLLVAAVDDHSGPGMPGQGRAPDAVLAPDHAVGHHVAVVGQLADLGARARVQRTQQLHRGFHFRQRLAQFVGQAGHAAARQALQRTVGNAPGQGQAGGVRRQHVQLQLQAFTQGARADPDRVEALDLVQHGQDLGLIGVDGRQQGLGDGRQRLAQVTVFFEGVDQRRADAAVARGQVRQVQLPQQVVGQAFGFGHALGGAAVVIIVEGTAAVAAAPVAFAGGPVLAGAGLVLAIGVGIGGGGRALVVAGRHLQARLGVLGPVQQRVGFHCFGDFQLQLRAGHLQQLDGLTQLRRHDQLLPQRCLQPCFHACAERREGVATAADQSLKVSPR
ncbi:hypothetical protein D3C71_1066550 [compost metagenome]